MSKLSLGVQAVAAPRSIDPATTALVRLAEADRALALAVDLASAVPLVRQARMLKEWAQAVDAGRDHQKQASVFVLRAMRNAGERLAEAQARGEVARPQDGGAFAGLVSDGDKPATLADLGVSRNESSDWQRLAETYTDPELVEVAAEMDRPSLAGALNPRLAGLMTSDSAEWYTPPEVIAAAIKAMGAIDLDPCADAGHNVPAAQWFTQADNGLDQPWRGRVYMNPPYGRDINLWIAKLVEEFEYNNVSEAIALVPGRIDTAWYRALAERGKATACHVSGRLRFSDADPAPFPSVAVYLGDDAAAFIAAFAGLGTPWRMVA